jgi:hypothetical protein
MWGAGLRHEEHRQEQGRQADGSPLADRVVRRVVVHDEVLVRRRPLGRDTVRPADQVDDLHPVGAVLGTG